MAGFPAVTGGSKVVLYGPKNPETMRVIAAVNAAERAQGRPVTEFLGFLHGDPERKGTLFHGLPIFGGFESVASLAEQGAVFVSLVTGSTLQRYLTARRLVAEGGTLGRLIFPSVDCSTTVLGEGVYIQEGAMFQAEVTVGVNTSISMGSIISHEVSIGCSTFVANAVSVSGEVTIGDGVFIGTNATILPRLRIGNWTIIGAGAVVLHDVPDYAVVVGNPANVIRFNERQYVHANPLVHQDGAAALQY